MKLLRYKATFLLIVLLLILPAAFAPSHPDEIDPETEEVSDYLHDLENIPAGVTPDSFFHVLDTTFENIQLALTGDPAEKALLLVENEAERLAEAEVMLEEGDTGHALEAVELAEETSEARAETLETLTVTSEHISELIELTAATIHLQDTAEELATDAPLEVAEALAGVEQAEDALLMEEKMEEAAEVVAEVRDIPVVEAELLIEGEQEAAHLDEVEHEEVQEELGDAVEELKNLQEEVQEALEEDQPQAAALQQLLQEAQTKLEVCNVALGEEKFGKAFGQLTAAQHLLDNADRLLEHENPQQAAQEATQFLATVGQDRKEDQQRNFNMREEWEKVKDQHPKEEQEHVQKFLDKEQEITQLADSLSGEFESLVAAGTSAEDAAQTISGKFQEGLKDIVGDAAIVQAREVQVGTAVTVAPTGSVQEVEYASGEFIPPGFEPVSGEVGEFTSEGGLVKDFLYEDPVTGTRFKIVDEGYMVITLEGKEKLVKVDVKYEDIPYQEGNEEHTYEVETSEGKVTYVFSPTGYEVTKSDGTKESKAYPVGTHEFDAEGNVEQLPWGYDLHVRGEEKHWALNPEYDHYVSSETGEAFVPEEGTSLSDEIHYNYDYRVYFYRGELPDYVKGTVPEEKKAEEKDTKKEEKTEEKKELLPKYTVYDPSTAIWKLPVEGEEKREEYHPEVKSIAPIGHEGEGEVTIPETAETWFYNVNKWEKVVDEKEGIKVSYNPETGEYISPAGTEFVYDHLAGTFEHTDETTGDKTHWEFNPADTSWSATQSYDAKSGKWEELQDPTAFQCEKFEDIGQYTVHDTETGETLQEGVFDGHADEKGKVNFYALSEEGYTEFSKEDEHYWEEVHKGKEDFWQDFESGGDHATEYQGTYGSWTGEGGSGEHFGEGWSESGGYSHESWSEGGSWSSSAGSSTESGHADASGHVGSYSSGDSGFGGGGGGDAGSGGGGHGGDGGSGHVVAELPQVKKATTFKEWLERIMKK